MTGEQVDCPADRPRETARNSAPRPAAGGHSASHIVKRYARRVGLEVPSFSGHSLRSGFLTGANIFKMAEVSRHRRLDTLRGYVRRVDLFKVHAGGGVLVSCT